MVSGESGECRWLSAARGVSSGRELWARAHREPGFN